MKGAGVQLSTNEREAIFRLIRVQRHTDIHVYVCTCTHTQYPTFSLYLLSGLRCFIVHQSSSHLTVKSRFYFYKSQICLKVPHNLTPCLLSSASRLFSCSLQLLLSFHLQSGSQMDVRCVSCDTRLGPGPNPRSRPARLQRPIAAGIISHTRPHKRPSKSELPTTPISSNRCNPPTINPRTVTQDTSVHATQVMLL